MQLAAELDRGLRARSKGRGSRQKWAQMRAAFALEAGWDKHQILETYLNLVSFRIHFGAQLNLRPASLVCGVTVLTPRSKRGWVSARFRAPDGNPRTLQFLQYASSFYRFSATASLLVR